MQQNSSTGSPHAPHILASFDEARIWIEPNSGLVMGQMHTSFIAMTPEEFVDMFAPAVEAARKAITRSKIVQFGRAT